MVRTETSPLTVHPLNFEENHLSDLATFALRDLNGFLWIGTDNGIKRYDGYRLQSFTGNATRSGSIESSFISVITQLSSGQIWAASRNLSVFHQDTESFTSYDVSDNKIIRALFEDNRGILWFAGDGFGLKGFDLKTKKVVHQYFNDSNTSFIQAIALHAKPSNSNTKIPNLKPSTQIWILARTEIILFNTLTQESQFFPIPNQYGLDQDSATAMIEDHKGKLWITSHRGLIVFSPNTQTFKHYDTDPRNPNKIPTNALWNVFEDFKGQVWIGTDKNGVLTYQEESDSFLTHAPSLTEPNSFPIAGIGKINEDLEGNIWIVASVSGIRRLSPQLEKFKVIKHKDNKGNIINHGYISDILEDHNGNIWTAIDGAGLNVYNKNTNSYQHYQYDPNNSNSLSSNSTLSLAEDSEGFIWIGTWAAGLNRFNPQTGEFFHIQHTPQTLNENTLGGDNIFRIEPTADGKLLLSIWEYGLQIYDIKSQKMKSYFGDKYGASNRSILDFLKREDGTYWVAGYQGLEIFNPMTEQFTPIEIPNCLNIIDLHQDREHNLWIASNTGIFYFNSENQEIKHYTTEHGLSNNFAVSIEEDKNANLWIGTRDGLNQFNPITEDFKVYGVLDGLSGQKFNRFSHLVTQNHIMYFGGKEGLNFFDPLHIPSNPTPPQVHLTDFRVHQKPIKAGDTEWMTHNIDTLKKLVLPSTANDITFEFSALSLTSPTQNQYKYTLEGLNNQWIKTDARNRHAHYSNLNPGHYVFKVQGSNNDGVWSLKSKDLEIIILPPLWLTWWAKVIYVILLILCLGLFSYWLLNLNRKRQKELEYKVLHDPLTGLKNRTWLTQHLTTLIKLSTSRQSLYGLLYLDGNGFKRINEKYGHSFGDFLIQKTPERINKLLPKSAHLIRLEGDQFIIVIDAINSEQEIESLAKSIIQCLGRPFKINDLSIKFLFNIGAVLCTSLYKETNNIMRDANTALQTAKKVGGGCWKIFDTTMLKDKEEDTEIELDLRTALSKNQFSVVFQPIIYLQTGELKGFELLLRWTHPEKGMIAPDKFIPIAEKSGLIFEIGLWVLKQACQQQQLWKQQLPSIAVPSIAVNLSPLQLLHSNLTHELDIILKESGADSRHIKIEITETALVENIESVNSTLYELRERHLDLAIDDFGTGYSSLSYLSKLPAQFLKIDRSFINELTQDKKTGHTKEIVKATIALAHNLNMEVVAEGIETQEQMELLKIYDCDYGQGYFIDRPLSILDATALLIKSSVEPPTE